MTIDKVVTFLSRFIPFPEIGEVQVFAEWKNKVLIIMLGAFVLIGPIAFIPGVAFGIKEGVWGLVISNTFIYSVFVIVAFSKKIGAQVKVIISTLMFFLLGITVFLLIGTRGSAFNWMFIFVLLSCFFYGYKGLIYSEILSTVAFILLYVPIHFNSPYTVDLNAYGRFGWAVNVILFLCVTVFFSILLNEMLRNLDQSLKKEKNVSALLRENKLIMEAERNRAKEADMLKSQFLANMSHEIRTPMNALLGFSNMLGEPGLPKEMIDRYRNIITVSGEQLLRIIDDIIDVSKIESNQMKIELSRVNVIKSLYEALDIGTNKIQVQNKQLSIELQIPGKNADFHIVTDEIRFKQILTNLIDNAIKYSDSGTIKIGYNLKRQEKRVEFFVSDEGPGIPEAEQKLIFDRFSQASNIEFKKGTGLGLTIVSGLLQLLGGKIWLTSEPEKGSTFFVMLPLEEQLEEEHHATPQTDVSLLPNLLGKNIFIAEDDDSSYLLINHSVKLTGAATKRAQNGIELLQMMAHELPDLVLLDINMPEMNGLDALVKLRKNWPHLPVIAQTAYAMPEERKKCLDYGCSAYIAKPIKQKQLFDLLRSYLQ
ncbi:ATP-binding protein [uncultured Draconibacterium sp.]|uniref:ATP-binding protein n=1 Tax=uncultured Draconibacterium sp. TaxID=1573823 RepID=UPI003260DC53